mmetsp:Transcript_65686/g.174035  ORF Transcript_65686/g.174035 Transcript_65686/m.174035 type:complete len:215 (+) Transcript_65686:293-937(+)
MTSPSSLSSSRFSASTLSRTHALVAAGKSAKSGFKELLPRLWQTVIARPSADCCALKPVTPSARAPHVKKGFTLVTVHSMGCTPHSLKRPGNCRIKFPTVSRMHICMRPSCAPRTRCWLRCASSLFSTSERPKKGCSAAKATHAAALSCKRIFGSPSLATRTCKISSMANAASSSDTADACWNVTRKSSWAAKMTGKTLSRKVMYKSKHAARKH